METSTAPPLIETLSQALAQERATSFNHTDTPSISDLRYERKFVIRGNTSHAIEAILKLHPALFSSVYQPRFVNNIYLDTPGRAAYHSAVEGCENRKKVRIRWYGDWAGEIDHPVLEFKIKKGLAGYKISTPLPSFYLGAGFSRNDLKDVIERSRLSDNLLVQFEGLEPSLINRYCRSYFLTADKKIRATIDSRLSFHDVSQQRFNSERHICEEELMVLEIKYAIEHEETASAITSRFPIRLSKSSKYVTGVELLNQWK